jgi:hypothetical protein
MARDINRQIEQRIQAFASELNDLVRAAALQAVADALGGKAPSISAGPGPSSRAPRAARGGADDGGGGRRSSAQLSNTMDTIRDFIAQNPGSRMEQISKGVGRTTPQLRLPINKLLAQGAIRKRGEKRATEYFVGAGGGSSKSAPKRKTAKRRGRKKGSRRK